MVIMPTMGRMVSPLQDAGVIRGPARADARARREASLSQLHRLELEPFLGPEEVAHRIALVDDVSDGRGHHVVGPAIGLEPHPLGPEGECHRCAGAARGTGRAHAGPSPLDLGAPEDPHGQEIRGPDEAGHEDRARALIDVARRADLLQPAAAHDRDTIRHGQRLVLVMGDVDGGDADFALQALELDLHVVAKLLVEGAERLVEEEHGGPRDEGPRQGHPLLLAPGELARIARAIGREPDQRERLADAALELPALHPRHAEPEGDVLIDGAMGEERVVLEDHAHAPAMGGDVVDPAPLDEDIARGRIDEPRHRAEGRRLAAARRAQEGEELAGVDGERHAVEGQRLPVALDESAELDVRRRSDAQRSSLFQRSVHWGRCRATLAQSKSTSLSTSAGPLMIFRATSGGSLTVLLVGLKKSSVAKAVCTSGERYMSTSFHASSLFFEPLVTWMTWSRMGTPSDGAAQSTGIPRFWRSYAVASCITAITTSFDSRYFSMVPVKSTSFGCMRLMAAMPASTSKYSLP